MINEGGVRVSYSSVCFAATSPILGEEFEYQTF